MKNTTIYLALVIVSVLSSCKKETKRTDLSIGNLTISPSHLHAGEMATINYTGKDSLTESIFYYMVNNKTYPVDINFSEEKAAIVHIPDSAQALAFQFKKHEGFDNNNEQGYLVTLLNAQDNEIPGSKAALANFCLSYWGANQGIKKDKDSLILDIKQAIEKHPELKDTWHITYLSYNYRNNPENGKALINEQINTILQKPDATEADFKQAVSLSGTIRNKALSDSITEITISKFPNSELANMKLSNAFFTERDPDKQLKIFEESGHNFNNRYKDYALSTIARNMVGKRDYEGFTKYASQISNKQSLAMTYNNFAWDLVQKDENLEFAENISKQSIDIIQNLKNDSSTKPEYQTKNQYKKSLQGNYVMFADTYAWILFKLEKVKEAITYQEEITQNLEIGKNDPHNLKQRLIEFLVADKQFEKAQKKAELFIRNAASNDKMLPYYKEAYVNNNGSEDGYKTHLESLKNEAKNIVLAKYKKEMLDEEAPNFKLKNLEGKEIALSDLKDKVVVLDFWATWCGPCKASFPGMQTAINKYKDNPNVVFLFVDTRERGTPEEILKNAQDFITKNKYTFNVVLDTKAKATDTDFEVVSNYKVNGIPTKIIIGSDGRIKFKSVGYNGSPDKLVNELDIMIRLAQS
ncbi:TlpA family protein disulfide reductase [Snuella sedimenti]|uniref:Redoxin domain-containing protein n=1 Tax=Snuella sedimenti TaxID=2798802 RepID=A0A8J7II67_9FLAO|nr:redoxin domain-containing protein [Snuella sedimenti]MBJ6369288.1 redoxin domain-containing protein [Snuella sedimenti]